ncbi:DUF4007 family protein [Carboxydocella sp. ULO1]|uniref:DUF4007 family protein n=1 Tax=Carboxydocella sp. ULO1 TaxID=1926599 RepID=UPI0009AE6EC2|nr:DUF4007 family protein [Carboxydocella sp. ULO1]GAW28761.1 hypothetical protein ULO1_13310 [Carboxydocella sp. ULO1]
MRFARHETFHIREGWLTKGLRKIQTEGKKDIFQRKDAMEELGIGSNMVKSLRYWMQATGLTEEKKGKKGQELTEYGQVIYEYDRYFEEDFTLWLIHYFLCTNKEMATSWYWFFNIFNHKEFDEDIFLSELELWVSEEGQSVATSSLKKDFDCIINTYLYNKENNYLNPEDNLGSPLQELGIIEKIDSKNKKYRFTRRNIKKIPKDLFLFAILRFVRKKNLDNAVSIEALLTEPESIGRVFSLSWGELIQILEILQADGFVYITKTAGLNNVSIRVNKEPIEVIIDYYKSREEQR